MNYQCVFYGGRLLSNTTFDDENIDNLINLMNVNKHSISLIEICDKFGFKDTRTFKKNYLNNLIENDKLKMTIPNQPKNRNQKYIAK